MELEITSKPVKQIGSKIYSVEVETDIMATGMPFAKIQFDCVNKEAAENLKAVLENGVSAAIRIE